MDLYPPGTLKFTKARFSVLFAHRPEDPVTREVLRNTWRGSWIPPAWMPEQWYVARTFRYWTDGEGQGAYFDVPGGDLDARGDGEPPFVFDGASVPWPLTIFVPKTHPIYLGASALHDYLYARRHEDVSRREADDYFLDALLISGLNWFWAGAMWRAVRAAGWSVWYRRKPETLLGKFLIKAPMPLRIPVVTAATVVIGIAGILGDLFVGALKVIRRDKVIRARE